MVALNAARSQRVAGWLCPGIPLGRMAAFRTVAYLFVVFDVLIYSAAARDRAAVPGEFYRPLAVARLLPIFPAPTPTVVTTVFWTLLVLAPLAATGRAPRLLGWTIFALYFEWSLIYQSFGKVDHDRLGFVIALAVLPTVGRARHGDAAISERAGWALRLVQFGAVATYFLAGVSKLRFSGLGWLTSATLAWSVVRRGTILSDWILRFPLALTVAQFVMVGAELLTPLIFALRERWRVRVVFLLGGFHLMTYLAIGISFLPHVVSLLAFLPLERVRPVVWWRARSRPAPARPGPRRRRSPRPDAGD